MARGAPAILGTAEVAVVLPAVRALEARGIRTESILSAADLAPSSLERVDERVPYERVLALWEHAAVAAGDPAFGIEVAETMPRGALDLLEYLFCASPTLLDAYRRTAKYVRIHVDSATHRVELSTALVKVTRYRGGDAGAVARQYREFMTAAAMRRGRDGTGVHWIPRRVSFGHPPHAARDRVDRFFGTKVEYGLGADTVWLDRATAALPLSGSDSRLSAILIRYADSLLATLPSPSGFVGMAHSAIVRELSNGSISVAKGAARLRMSERTFQRRLRSLHTSHRELLDATRFDLASAYLADPAVSITVISFMLAFADLSAFTRAFKRWSGMTPSEFRRRHSSSEPGASEAMAASRGRERMKVHPILSTAASR